MQLAAITVRATVVHILALTVAGQAATELVQARAMLHIALPMLCVHMAARQKAVVPVVPEHSANIAGI